MNTKVADFVAAQRDYMAKIQAYNTCLKNNCFEILNAKPLAGQTLPQQVLNMQAECKKLTPAPTASIKY